MILNIFFITLLGLVTTYTDLKRRIIENRVILIGLVAAPLLHLYQLVQNPTLLSVIPYMIYNLLFSVFAGVLLWYIYIWPAGDAKLFIVFSFLIPLNIYHAEYFISFDFLINTFVPVFFVMLLVLLKNAKRSDMKKSIKHALDPYTLFMATLVITGFMWFFLGLFSLLGLPQDYLITLVVLFVIIEILNKISPFNLEYTYIILAVIRILIDYRNVLTFGFAYYLFSLLFIFMVLRSFVTELGFGMHTLRKKIEDLKPGMCLAEGIREERDGETVKYEKEGITQFTIMGALKDRGKKKFIHNMSFGGLTKKDVERIKRLRKEGKIRFDDILVHTITPFALFLFYGILLTIFLKTNFVFYLKVLLLG